MVALYLMALQQNPKRPKTPVGHKQQTSKLVTSGKAFLRHLEIEYRIEEASLAFAEQQAAAGWRPALGWLREQQELLDRIDRTRRSIECLLPSLVPHDSHRDPVRQVAECARQAWREANNGRAPLSMNPDDPLCRFVLAALKLIKQEIAADTVSAVLRGRRRK
jgi:hypothetical protein